MSRKTAIITLTFEAQAAHTLPFYLFGALHALAGAMWELHSHNQDLPPTEGLHGTEVELPMGALAIIRLED